MFTTIWPLSLKNSSAIGVGLPGPRVKLVCQAVSYGLRVYAVESLGKPVTSIMSPKPYRFNQNDPLYFLIINILRCRCNTEIIVIVKNILIADCIGNIRFWCPELK